MGSSHLRHTQAPILKIHIRFQAAFESPVIPGKKFAQLDSGRGQSGWMFQVKNDNRELCWITDVFRKQTPRYGHIFSNRSLEGGTATKPEKIQNVGQQLPRLELYRPLGLLIYVCMLPVQDSFRPLHLRQFTIKKIYSKATPVNQNPTTAKSLRRVKKGINFRNQIKSYHR